MKCVYVFLLFLSISLTSYAAKITVRNNTNDDLKVELKYNIQAETNPLYDGEDVLDDDVLISSKTLPAKEATIITVDDGKLIDAGLEVTSDGQKRSYWLDFHYDPKKPTWVFSTVNRKGKKLLRLNKK